MTLTQTQIYRLEMADALLRDTAPDIAYTLDSIRHAAEDAARAAAEMSQIN